jgi:hypothetical protein
MRYIVKAQDQPSTQLKKMHELNSTNAADDKPI